jgi:Cdc6-like AAA superfamily ATPase
VIDEIDTFEGTHEG